MMTPTSKNTYTIDGNHFSTLEEFYEEVSQKLIPGADWGRNLDAFNDILYGGFGTSQDGFILVWKNSARSRHELGSRATIAFFEDIWQCYQSRTEDELAQLHRDQLKRIYPDPEQEELVQREIEQHITQFHAARQDIENRLARAKRGEGDTVFDWIVNIIKEHADIDLSLE